MTEAANPVAHFLADWLTIPLVAILALNLLQRRYQQQAPAKRIATLVLSGLVLIVLCASFLMVRFQVPDAALIPVLAAVVLPAVLFRKIIFPFAFHCRHCGRRLGWKQALFSDDPHCPECHPEGGPGGRAG
jgi:hypothetical protein